MTGWRLAACALLLSSGCATTQLGPAGSGPSPDPVAASATERALDRAHVAIEAGRFDEAIRILADAATRAPDSADVANDLAVALLLSGDAVGAAQRAGAALQQGRATPELYVTLSAARLEQGDINGSVDAASRATNLGDLPEAWLALGRAWLAMGRPSEALSAFERVLDAAPRDADAWLGRLASTSWQPESADFTETQRAAREMLGESAAYLVVMGAAAETSGDAPAAEGWYRKALSKRADDPAAHYNLARLLHRLQGLEAARAHFEAFLRHAPAWTGRRRDEVRRILGAPP